jgi:hypothetical protein
VLIRTPVFHSGDGSLLVTLVFKNNAKSPVDVYWMDFEGKEQKYLSIAPGKSAEQGTYSTHAWRLRDLAGDIVMDYVATDEARQTIEISADLLLRSSCSAIDPRTRFGYSRADRWS